MAPSSTARGYGAVHRRIRQQLIREMDGKPCARCGVPLRTGDDVHLDHDDNDRSRYLGLSHALCNLRAGSEKGHAQRRRVGPAPAAARIRWSREWYADGVPPHVDLLR